MSSTQRAPYVVGLTGGVGSGKSTVARLFAERGVHVVDVDDISRALTATGGAAVAAVANAFPQAINEGSIDRGVLRAIVFSNATERLRLEKILHPLIHAHANAAIDRAVAQGACYVLLVVPLLFESNAYAKIIECTVVVDVPVEAQIARVTSTRNVTVEIAQGIVSAQMPRDERLKRAQFVVDNSGPMHALAPQIDSLHAVLLANANAYRANEIEVTAVV